MLFEKASANLDIFGRNNLKKVPRFQSSPAIYLYTAVFSFCQKYFTFFLIYFVSY